MIPTLISRTPSPQGAMSAPKQLRHTMRSGKSEMKKLLGERKAASNAATLAWVHKEGPGQPNAALAGQQIFQQAANSIIHGTAFS